MPVHQAFRYELSPNNHVRNRFASHCGASRFAYNWGLGLVKNQLELRDQIRSAAYKELLSDEEVESLVRQIDLPWSMYSLRKEFNRQKHIVAPWWKENSKFAYESGLTALAAGLANYSASKKGQRAGPVMEFPHRKKAGNPRSCRFWAGLSLVDERHVRLPRIGVVRSKEMTTELFRRIDRGTARILNATISEEAGRWFVSVCCEVEREDKPAEFPETIVGVDLGVQSLAVLSTGKVIPNPKPLHRSAQKMARLQRELSRRKKGSNRRARTNVQLSRCHRQVRCKRVDALHQLTAQLSRTYGIVVIEDLNVKGMTTSPKPRPDPDRPGTFLKNGKRAKAGLNRAILDVAPGEFRRQLSYKLAWRSGHLIVADRFFPSSRTCSSCGAVKAKLSLRERTFRCDDCGLVIDRDLNAARNLAKYGMQHVAGGRSETINGCGGEHRLEAQSSPMKHQDGSRKRRQTVLVGSGSN